jgi:glycosyltransferase involved in cell wall biosynthesis
MVRQALMEEGIRRGHALEFSYVRPRAQIKTHVDPDLWILADVWNVAWHWKRIHRRLWSRIPWTGTARYRRLVAGACKSGKFVHLDNAYVDVCDLPYLPCNGTVVGTECPFKKGLSSRQRKCFRTATQDLYRRSRFNLFVSPLHARVVNELVGLSSDRTYVMDPMIDSQLFRESADPIRDIPLLFVGPFNEAKGSETIRRRWPNGEVRIIGPRTPDAARYPGYVGPLPYSDVRSLMRRTRTFVFHPRWPEPFGRVVAEAALSGCALDTNDQVGALSFGKDLTAQATYAGAATRLWLRLESLF